MSISLASEPPKLDHCDRQIILDYFHNAWQMEDTLMKSVIEEETFYLNPDPLRNFLVFYLGHTPVFYINKLIAVQLLSERLNPDYEILFEVGVDPETPEELYQAITAINWPPVEQVWQYRAKAYSVITKLIQNISINPPIHQNHPLWALMMSIEHSRIHFETSSMLLRQLPVAKLKRPQGWNYAPSNGNVPENKMQEIPGGVVKLGKSSEDPTYGWDSEYGDRTIEVKPFLASQYLVSNAEFLEFTQAGGYTNPDYWHPAAWAWKQHHKIQHPKFWLPTSEKPTGYRYRATFDEMDLPLDWPAEVNHYEAIAFCRWKSPKARLMTEAEWNQALHQSERPSKATLPTTSLANNQQANNYNLNLQFISPSPVGMFKSTKNIDSSNLLYDLRGNVWEWIQDTFNPLTGFQPHPLYKDQSAPFFDNHHQMMLGGSWATNGSMALPSYRNWFRPYFYQHVGFRITQDLN